MFPKKGIKVLIIWILHNIFRPYFLQLIIVLTIWQKGRRGFLYCKKALKQKGLFARWTLLRIIACLYRRACRNKLFLIRLSWWYLSFIYINLSISLLFTSEPQWTLSAGTPYSLYHLELQMPVLEGIAFPYGYLGNGYCRPFFHIHHLNAPAVWKRSPVCVQRQLNRTGTRIKKWGKE